MGEFEIKSALIERLTNEGYKLYANRVGIYESFYFKNPDGKQSCQFQYLGEMLMTLDLQICPEKEP